MSNIISCDNCGAQSPDADGLHQANHWITVKVSWRRSQTWSGEFTYCEKCLPCQDLNVYHDGVKFLARIKAGLSSLCGKGVTQ